MDDANVARRFRGEFFERLRARASERSEVRTTTLLTGDFPPTAEEVLEQRGQQLQKQYEDLTKPLSEKLAGRGIPLGPIQWGPEGKSETLQAAYGGVYEGDDPSLAGLHEFTLTSDSLQGSVHGLRFGAGAIQQRNEHQALRKTVYLDDGEAKALFQ
ncbi:MAG: hypothetical protein AAFV29_25045, partial [Myxococcota bacterium]